MKLNIHSRYLSTTCRHDLSVVNLMVGAALVMGIRFKVDVHTKTWKHSIVKLPLEYNCGCVLTTF